MKLKLEIYTFFFALFFLSCKDNGTGKMIVSNDKDLASKAKCTSCKAPSRISALQSLEKKVVVANGEGREEMIFIKGGTYKMGSEEFSDSKPLHDVTINGFWMDAHEVTNAQFAAFVKATGYVTVAEQKLDPADYPGVPIENLVPGSAVFTPPAYPVSLNNPLQWWSYAAGASWKRPLGPNSSIEGKENEPVVQVSYGDAVAYATWAGKRLPTEAEWEYAAQAGTGNNHKYYWGDELKPAGKWKANIFQGKFPYRNTKDDGYAGIAPIKSYPPNALGLYDMDGNVWEWCSDFYRPDYYANSPAKDPKGPGNSFDPEEPNVEKHVQRGGSFLCSDDYCIRYKRGSRGKGETNSGSNNLGFRCVKDADANKKS